MCLEERKEGRRKSLPFSLSLQMVIKSVTRRDRGMYQCLVSREEGVEMAQAEAMIELGGKQPQDNACSTYQTYSYAEFIR